MKAALALAARTTNLSAEGLFRSAAIAKPRHPLSVRSTARTWPWATGTLGTHINGRPRRAPDAAARWQIWASRYNDRNAQEALSQIPPDKPIEGFVLNSAATS